MARLIEEQSSIRMAGRTAVLIAICFAAAGVLAAATDRSFGGETRNLPRPNIVYILADDLGYGDVRCFGRELSKIPTPHLDRMAEQGMIFTDAHACSSVCTPTRYGILTGRYCWRTRLQEGVLSGEDPPLIAPGRLTVAELLRQHGYATACIGKWHLGLRLPRRISTEGTGRDSQDPWRFDYTGRIEHGPVQLGFDEFFGISGSLDMWPFAFIRNDRFEPPPTVVKTWLRSGPAAADFEAVDVLPKLADFTVETIRRMAPAARSGKPFFIYLALTAPHTPIVPSKVWKGKSGLGEYADFVMETDDLVGRVLAAIDENGLARDTLVFFTSDNGCSPQAKIPELIAAGHYPNGPLRGQKADIWEGGHRIPLIVRWPGRVAAASRCTHPVCLNDLMATCADLVGTRLPDDAGEDSESMLPFLLQCGDPREQRPLVLHSIYGRFAIRQGKWKLILCPGSGGWSEPRDAEAARQGLPPVQLYDLDADLGEKVNLAERHPEIVDRLRKLLEKIVADGRSTPGAPQRNDVTVRLQRELIKSDR